MRKWTNDRQKRRKKGEGAAKERPANALEPLQPKYFESEIGEKPAERPAETAQAEPEHQAAEHSPKESASSEIAVSDYSDDQRMPSDGSSSVAPLVGSRTASGESASGRSSSRRSSGRSRRSGRLRPAAQRVAPPASPALEPSPNEVEPASTEGEKETQADFQLASRRLPELPLAEAVQQESSGRPARRRRKRGGRGGARGPMGGGATGASRGGAARDFGASRPNANFNAPLTPESVSGDAYASSRGAGADAPRSSPARHSSTPQRPAQAFPAQPSGAEALPVQSLPASSSAQSTPAPPLAAGTTIPVAPPRPSKGTVVLAIGLPGSGKSSWFKRHDIHPLSSDLLRELLFDDAMEQRFQDLVFSNLRSMLKARLIARRPMNYVDATNLTPHDRHSWIKLAKDYGYDVQGLFFDVPLEVCLERHARRGRAVPEDIMRKMAGKLKPPTFEEGFSKITVVRVKAKDAAAS